MGEETTSLDKKFAKCALATHTTKRNNIRYFAPVPVSCCPCLIPFLFHFNVSRFVFSARYLLPSVALLDGDVWVSRHMPVGKAKLIHHQMLCCPRKPAPRSVSALKGEADVHANTKMNDGRVVCGELVAEIVILGAHIVKLHLELHQPDHEPTDVVIQFGSGILAVVSIPIYLFVVTCAANA